MNNIEENNITSNIKKIIIEEPSNKNKNTKRINCEKEKKMRVETKTWGLKEEELSHQTQINLLQNILDQTFEKEKYISMLTSHIKTKICGYKQQDILKKKLKEDEK